MRAVLSKIVAGSMIAGAALLASACTSNESFDQRHEHHRSRSDRERHHTDTMVTNIDAAATENGVVVENTPRTDEHHERDVIIARHACFERAVRATGRPFSVGP
jgi:Ni/Co efflux regulator RcnB